MPGEPRSGAPWQKMAILSSENKNGVAGATQSKGEGAMTQPKRKTLYTLTEEYAQLYELMASGDEITDEQMQELMDASDDLMQKLDAYGVIMSELNGKIAHLKEEEKRISDWRKEVERNVERLKNSITNTMQFLNLDKTETEHWRYSFRTSKAVEVTDEFLEFAQFYGRDDLVRTSVTPDKTAIKLALEKGEDIPATIVERKSLQVK